MRRLKFTRPAVIPLAACALLLQACATDFAPDVTGCEHLPINQVQRIGSHNSYRVMPPPTVMDELERLRPGVRERLEYEHPPLGAQLNLGLRLLEIDLYADPDGGFFADPPNLDLLEDGDARPFDPMEIARPGFKVMHIQGYDNYSHCVLLEDCLGALANWADDHPQHSLIVVTLNVKEDRVFDTLPIPPQFDADRLAELDETLLSVFGRERLLVPDDIRAGHSTLREAVLAAGWPSVSETRGKFMFVLDEGTPSASLIYKQGHPSLSGRIMFANYPATDDEAAFMVYWNLLGREAEVASLVEQGFLVRVASDVGTQEARTNDKTRLQAAIDSGAQFIASDYYPGHISPFETDYVAQFETGQILQCDAQN